MEAAAPRPSGSDNMSYAAPVSGGPIADEHYRLIQANAQLVASTQQQQNEYDDPVGAATSSNTRDRASYAKPKPHLE